MISLTFFRRYFFSKRAGALVRSLARLCLVANFISVLALVLVLSIMNGFRDTQERKLLAVEPHLVLEGPDAELRFSGVLQSDETRLRAAAVEEIAAFEKQDVIVRTVDGAFSGAIAKGLAPVYLSNLLDRAFQSHMHGDRARTRIALGPGEVVMGVELARQLGAYEGDEVTLMAPEGLLMPAGEIPPYEKVRIATILATDIADIDSQLIFYDQSHTLSRLRRTNSYESGIEVRLQHPQDAEAWKKELVPALPGLTVATWGDRNSALFFALKMEKVAMSTFLSLSILITCFGLFTVLIMLITQKRKDIGLMMALGLSRRRTQRLFVSVGAILSFSGMMLGLLCGVAAAYLIAHFSIPVLPDIYVDSRLPARVDWAQVGFITAGLLVLGLLAAWLPVRSGLTMTPSESLRGRG